MGRLRAVISVLVLLPFHFFSQLQVKNFFSITGKRDVSVNVITQDSSGYLLIGTSEGVYRFDGKTATEIIPGEPRIKKEVTAVHIAKNQAVWIGCKDGSVYFADHNRLDSVPFKKGQNTERITAFGETSDAICAETN